MVSYKLLLTVYSFMLLGGLIVIPVFIFITGKNKIDIIGKKGMHLIDIRQIVIELEPMTFVRRLSV